MVIANGAFRRGVRGAVPSNLGTGQWHWIFGNTYVTDEPVVQLRYYSAESGQSPFEDWFTDLDAPAAAKVVVALARLEQGNNSNAKGIGEGVFENRIDWGPGYRVYFGMDGDALVILLTGGTKRRQQRDIEAAKAMWRDYKRRRKPSPR